MPDVNTQVNKSTTGIQTSDGNFKAFQGALPQTEVNYTPLSPQIGSGKSCANCRWFLNDGCFIVQNWEPEPIIATGYCDRHEMNSAPSPDLQEELVEAVGEAVVEVLSEVSDTMAQFIPMKEKRPFTQRVKEMLGLASKTQVPKLDEFSIFKNKTTGQWCFHAVHTNNYEDLEQEILTQKAHDNYINRVDMGLVPAPVLQAWHTPGSEHGQVDFIWRNDHFVHSVGHFFDTPLAQKAIAYYQKNSKNLKMSHGFTAPEWAFDGKYYDDYNTFEITTLPAFAAANPYTSFEEILTMPMTPQKKEFLVSMFGEDGFNTLQAKDSERAKALETLGAKFKDMGQTNPTPTNAAQPAPVPNAPTPAPASAPPTANANEVLKALYLEVTDNYNQVVGWVSALVDTINNQSAYIKSLETRFDTETAAWQSVIDEVRVQVNLPVGRASQSQTTQLQIEGLKNLPTLGNALPAQPLPQNPQNGPTDPIAFLNAKAAQPAPLSS